MHQRLADLGYTKAQRNAMKPQEAQDIIAKGVSAQPAAEAAAPPEPAKSVTEAAAARTAAEKRTPEENYAEAMKAYEPGGKHDYDKELHDKLNELFAKKDTLPARMHAFMKALDHYLSGNNILMPSAKDVLNAKDPAALADQWELSDFHNVQKQMADRDKVMRQAKALHLPFKETLSARDKMTVLSKLQKAIDLVVSRGQEARKFPQPNEHGVYSDDDTRVKTVSYKGKKATAKIDALQTARGWIAAPTYEHLQGNFGGMGTPLSDMSPAFPTEEEAVSDAAHQIITQQQSIMRDPRVEEKQKAEARKVMAWAVNHLTEKAFNEAVERGKVISAPAKEPHPATTAENVSREEIGDRPGAVKSLGGTPEQDTRAREVVSNNLANRINQAESPAELKRVREKLEQRVGEGYLTPEAADELRKSADLKATEFGGGTKKKAPTDEDLHNAVADAFAQTMKTLKEEGWTFDPQWGPLELILKPEELDQFMFMGKHPHPTKPGRSLYEYKNGITRRYLRLDDEGQAYGFKGDATTEAGKYPPMDLDKAVAGAYEGLESMGETRTSKYNETFRRKRDEALIKAGFGVARATPEGTLTSLPKPKPDVLKTGEGPVETEGPAQESVTNERVRRQAAYERMLEGVIQDLPEKQKQAARRELNKALAAPVPEEEGLPGPAEKSQAVVDRWKKEAEKESQRPTYLEPKPGSAAAENLKARDAARARQPKVPETPEQFPLMDVPKEAKPLIAERRQIQRILDKMDASNETDVNDERRKPLEKRLAEIERQLMPEAEKPIEAAKPNEQPALPAKDAPAPAAPVNPPKTVEPVPNTEKFTLENVDVPEARLALSRLESPSKKFKVQRMFLKQAVADAAQTAKPEEALSKASKQALEDRRKAHDALNKAVFKEDIKAKEKGLAQADAKVRAEVPHVEIHVPGDGIFTVIKTREALKDFAERVEKRFPKSAAKPGGPGFAREGVTPTPKLGTGKPEDTHKAAASHAGTDETRVPLLQIYGNGQELIATDGRRMIRIIEPGHGTQKNPVAMDPATGKERPWDVSKDGGQYPDYSQVIPKKRFYVGVADTEALWKAAKMAELMTDDKSIQMQLWRNKDGTFGATAKSQSGEAAHNVKDGAQLMMALQPSYLIDALESARRLGNEHVDLYMGEEGELSPITIRGKNSEDIIMPMRLGDASPPPGVGMEGYKKGWWEDIDAKMKPLFKKPLPEGVPPDKTAAEKLAKEQAEAEKAAKKQAKPASGGVGPAGPGLGAAIPEEFAPSSQTPTGIKNATVDRERAQRGLPPAIQMARKSFGEVWDRAMARIDQDAPVPGDPLLQDKLIAELRSKPRALTDEEDALLLHRQIDLQNEYGKATRDLAQARDDGRAEDVQELGLRTAALSDKLLELYNINKSSGTETGRGLNARKMMANEDFTLAAMELSARAAKGGRRLDEQESAEIARLHAKIAAMQKAYNDHVAATEKTIRELETRKRIKRLTEEEQNKPKAAKGAMTEEERQQKILTQLEKMVKEGKRGSDLSNIIQQLARHYVRKGVKDRDTLVDKVHAIVVRLVPEMERRDTMDAISGYGDFRQLSKDQVSRELRDLKGQMQQVAKLEDMQAGAPPSKTGVERRTPSAEERRLIKLVNEAKRKFQIPVTDPGTQLKSSLDTLKTRMRNRTKELQDKLDAGDFAQKEAPKPIQMDQEALRLKAALERTKTEYLTGLEKDRLAQRTPLEKFQDALVKWRRGYLLSGWNTLAKLVSAAAERMAFSPLEEAAGSGLAKLFPRFAGRTSRKVGLNVSAEAKAITEGFTKGMTDAVQTLKTGHSDLDVLYGKRDVMPREAIDFFGQLHGALKAPTKRNEFARSFEQRVQSALDKGVDVSDPMVQTGLALEAYKDANRSIFLQDNRVVSAYKRALSKFDEVDKETGKVPFTSKAAGTAARVLLPIVKIPTNLVAETMDYALGTVTGGTKLALAYRKGIESLPPGQADLIARQLKKGSLGAAVLLLGFLNPGTFGGYYQAGQRRDKKDVKVGGVRVFGVNIPSYLVHNPLLETLQLGATVRRVAQSKLRKGDQEREGLGWGLWAGALGLLDETPFLREASEVLKLANAQERQGAAGELAKSLIVPQVVADIARVTDRDAKGNIIERKPRTIGQHVKTGIPGLRETVRRKPAP